MSQILLDAFAPGSIATAVRASNRSDAIRAVGKLLVESGRTTANYTEEMLSVVEEFGPYFVLAPGIAIAHSKPSDSVLSSGMALAVLEDPVIFGSEHNDPVRLLFALCAVDHDSHITVLAELASLLADVEMVNSLLNKFTEEEIRTALSNAL
jgi:PTS system ascorbate-specific IIA component